MAVLTDEERRRVWIYLMRARDQVGTLGALTKADLRAAVDATDLWIDTNQASFNTALPTNARTNLTLAQKTLLFCYVAMRRAGTNVLRVDEDNV